MPAEPTEIRDNAPQRSQVLSVLTTAENGIRMERQYGMESLKWRGSNSSGHLKRMAMFRISHIAEHGLTPDDFEYVFLNFESETLSRSTGRPMRFGETEDGRNVCIVFEWLEDELTVYPVTAFQVR